MSTLNIGLIRGYARIVIIGAISTFAFISLVGLNDSHKLPQSRDMELYMTMETLQNQVVRLQQEMAKISGNATERTTNVQQFKSQVYPRVCCFIITDPKLLPKTSYVRDTWARRCDHSFFMSSEENKTFPTIGLGNSTRGRQKLMKKARESWIYLYKHHIDDCEYFVKADPDTYIIVENLKEYLSHFNPKDSQYFGHMYRPPEDTFSYMAGGPGEVLSRQALRDLVEKAFMSNSTNYRGCHVDTGGEDRQIGRCLALIRTEAVDTRDSRGRQRFIVLGVSYLIKGSVPKWYMVLHQLEGKLPQGYDCCSEHPIGFHYVSELHLKYLEYLIYGVHKKFDLGIKPGDGLPPPGLQIYDSVKQKTKNTSSTTNSTANSLRSLGISNKHESAHFAGPVSSRRVKILKRINSNRAKFPKGFVKE